jgi:2,4-dienoyl-CoA reductase-like NADH-dependent reductase (Old Yellow Enzyme family)
VVETIKAVREAVGNDFALGIRLSQVTVADPDYQLPEGEAGFRQIAEAVRDAGADFVHTTDGYVRRAPFIEGTKTLADVVAEVANLELIINGGIDETNYQDFAANYPEALLAIGKKALAEPKPPSSCLGGFDPN